MKLSIITINLNNKQGLISTIESVIAQDFREFEFIIIDGGSNDGSVDVIKEYNEIVDYWISEKDAGIYNALNKGIGIASGDYCMFLNSGDSLYENKTLHRVFEERNDGFDILYGDSIFIKSNGKHHIRIEPDSISLLNFFNGSLCHQAMFIKKKLFTEQFFGLYREDLKIASDWEFNIRAIIIGNCTTRHLPYPIVYYNFEGISSVETEISLSERESVFRQLFPGRLIYDYNYITDLEQELKVIKRSIIYRICKKLSLIPRITP